MTATGGLLVRLLALYLIESQRDAWGVLVRKAVRASVGFVVERSAYRAQPLNVLVRVALGLIGEQAVEGSREKLVVGVRALVPGIQPCRDSALCGFLGSEDIGLTAVTTDRHLVHGGVVAVIVLLGDGLTGRELAGVQVDEDALGGAQERMVPAREDGDVLGALRGGEHLDHGGEGLCPLVVPGQLVDSQIFNAPEIGEVEGLLAASHQLAGGLLSQEDLSEPQQRSLPIHS